MKPYELRGGEETSIDLRADTGTFSKLPEARQEVGFVRIQDELLLCWGAERVPVSGVDARAHARLSEAASAGAMAVAWCVRATDQRVTVHVRSYHDALPIDRPLMIGIDEGILDELRRGFGVTGGVVAGVGWLEERLFLASSDPARRRAVISGGEREVQTAFRIFGRGIAVDVAVSGNRLRIERVVKSAPVNQAPLHLLDAPLAIADLTETGPMAETARRTLEKAVRSAGSYLRIWSTYADMERQAVMARARRIGALRYERKERRRDGGYRFHLARVSDLEARLAGLDDQERFELEAGESAPNLRSFDDLSGRETRRMSAPVLAVDMANRVVDLRAPEDDEDQPTPPEEGYLYLSLTGDRTSLRRRQIAEEKLRTGNTEILRLGLLLEGQPVTAPQRKARSEMSPAVLEAFGGRPTDKQREALRVAINTPDIALIQGPPGTGKTKVITALARRLAELSDEGAEVSHRILVSSAQHDAVENVVQRSEVFGLPAVKIGSRRGDDGAALDSVEQFRFERIDRLRATLRVPPDEEKVANVRRLATALLRVPTPPAETARHLRDLAEAVTDLVPPALRDAVVQRAAVLARPTQSGAADGRDQMLAAVRGLRVSKVAFEDDGPVKAHKALVRLDPVLALEERALLSECVQWCSTEEPPFLGRLAALQEALLDRLAVPPPEAPGIDIATHQLLIQVIDTMDGSRRQSARGEGGVLAAYLSDLENDPAAVRAALEHYTVVLAATCQQSASGAMRAARGLDTAWPHFETVIVDEAARANPLDLFIPMTMARRRVVLVGDHRQLPHMLEPDVERDVAAAVQTGSLAAEAQAALKESLFGRLWDLLRTLEERDGVPRTVRLDTQYRMHPLLGDFVSEVFYEKNQEGKLFSALPMERFPHRLPPYQKAGQPCAAAWLDIPGGPGHGERRGRSKARPAEARRIARELKALLAAEPQLTFGIVAFYSAQVTAIAEALIDEKIAERTEAGGWRIVEGFRRTANARGERVERLRLGTVDAFQGKEFDVVILSLTRSNDLPAGTEEERRRKYGHLLLANRLCVAMSRQRRLLIVAGDRAFATESEHLLPFKRFSELCEGPHGTIRR